MEGKTFTRKQSTDANNSGEASPYFKAINNVYASFVVANESENN